MKGIFGPYVLWPLDQKLIFWIVTRVSARDYTVCDFKPCIFMNKIYIKPDPVFIFQRMGMIIDFSKWIALEIKVFKTLE